MRAVVVARVARAQPQEGGTRGGTASVRDRRPAKDAWFRVAWGLGGPPQSADLGLDPVALDHGETARPTN